MAAMLLVPMAAMGAGACAVDTGSGMSATVARDSAGIRVVEHRGAALEETGTIRLADSAAFRIGSQAGAPDLQFTSIVGALRLPDGTFVILDRRARELRVFGAAGQFLRRIGGHGAGPGEFEDPARLMLGADTSLVVWDWRSQKVSWFRPDGEFIRAATLAGPSLNASAALSDGDLVAVMEESPTSGQTSSGGRMRNTGSLVRLTSGGGLTTQATFPGTEWFMRVSAQGVQIQRPWFVPRLLAAVAAGGVWLTDGTEWELTRRTLVDGQVDRIVRIQAPLARFTAERIGEIHAAELAAAPSTEARTARARYHEEVQYPETIPPIEDLFVDAEGRLWIGRLDAPPVVLPSGMGRATRRWTILTREGEEVVGTVSFPPKTHPLYSDREGVLLLTIDSDDVPYVEWWPFATWPSE